MLLQLREFIQRERMVSLQQMAREFRIDELALQPMLALWVRRGDIRESEQQLGCKSRCFRCKTGTPVFYEWVSSAS